VYTYNRNNGVVTNVGLNAIAESTTVATFFHRLSPAGNQVANIFIDVTPGPIAGGFGITMTTGTSIPLGNFGASTVTSFTPVSAVAGQTVTVTVTIETTATATSVSLQATLTLANGPPMVVTAVTNPVATSNAGIATARFTFVMPRSDIVGIAISAI
jgi:hypothetical protein